MTRTAWRGVLGVAAGAALSLTLGCQTWIGGMTLPSGHYLKDQPDYIPRGPSFPLGRELINMQAGSKVSSATPGAVPPGGAPAVPPAGPGAP